MRDHISLSYSSFCYLCLLLFMTLFHSCLSNQNANDRVLCIHSEKQALLRFKHGLVDESNRLASWGVEESNCCKWVGIICDNITGHVHTIHLRGLDGHCDLLHDGSRIEYKEGSKKRLEGDISPSLLDLKQLEHLDLSCNDFGGMKVPNFIGSFEKLRYLNLSNSEFGGTIPTQLGNLSELRVLCLGTFLESTSMPNMQWLLNLRLLHHLDMSGVHLNKAVDWFQVINALPSLVQLRLSNTQLPDVYSYVTSPNLTSLLLLDLSDNFFGDGSILNWIFSITSIVLLDLSHCNLNRPVPNSINSFRNLTSLKFLHVSENNFMSLSLLVLEELSSVGGNLISLDISNCIVTSSVLDELHNLTSLVTLDLSYKTTCSGSRRFEFVLCTFCTFLMTRTCCVVEWCCELVLC